MCGIVGIVGRREAAPLLLQGLRRLEYRGYDSAGMATLVEGRIERRRAEGKVQRLVARLAEDPLRGTTGIGHTRWATHGAPCEANAHPIATRHVAVVHNGIIENHRELREELKCLGERFESETDTEVVAILLTRFVQQGMTPAEAMAACLRRVTGALALAVIFAGHEDEMACARRGSPLALGHGDGEMFVGSDALALGAFTDRICYLEEGDFALVSRDGARIHDAAGRPVRREVRRIAACAAAEKGDHRHFMHKEILEQPAVIGATLHSMLAESGRGVVLPGLPCDLLATDGVTILACGTSYHAGLVARYWIESLVDVPVQVEIASEFRYRRPTLTRGSLVVAISQSGETADTLAALRHSKAAGARTLGVVNVPESSLAREADAVLRTLAGPEIGVASTKAFTTQLAALACLAIALGRERGTITHRTEAELVGALTAAPSRIAEALAQDALADQVAQRLAEARDVLYLGRGTAYPIALEGALKLKEISYIHAEGYAAGEMKHGPIALIERGVPVVILAPPDELFEKTAANMQEVMARGGQVVLVSSRERAERFADQALTIALPEIHTFAAPILYTIPVQQLAYHAARHRGAEVDQPRNLAKSVTVE